MAEKIYIGKPIDVWAELKKVYGNSVIPSGDYSAENVGSYSFTLTLNTERYPEAKWTDSDEVSVTVSWTISKAVLSGEWGANGKLELGEIEGMERLPDDLIDYKYYDEDGNEISSEERIVGRSYTVEASLNDKYKDNFELNAELAELISTSHAFTQEEEDRRGGCNGGFDILYIVCIVLTLILIIECIAVARVIRKRRQEAEEMSDDDDDEEEYYFVVDDD